jgi:hypothetical protein
VLLHLDIIRVFYSPTDAQVNCLKNNFKINIKIDIETAPACFSAITIIRERIIQHVGAVSMSVLMLILKLFLRQFTCASVDE